MKKYPDLKVVIEGHTDHTGKKAHNQVLSEKRAISVKSYMTEKFGIKESRLTARGYGVSKPIASNKTKAGRQKNRRVEAAVDYKIRK
jgi:OOP family OmpA-OmpF porin